MVEKNCRVAAIQDISGLGKCSLTVALPVLSSLGCETAVLPTAFLSTHTGGFQNPVYRDMTDDLMPTAQHWLREGAVFEAMCSGFLGSAAQIGLVSDIFDAFRAANPQMKILVDPVMGDDGRLYRTYTEEMAAGMCALAEKADILVPNRTESCRLLKKPYTDGPFSRAEIESDLRALSALGPGAVVMTGVFFDEKRLGAACYDRAEDRAAFFMADRAPGFFHGTGDLFASALLGALLNGHSLFSASDAAVRFTADCVERTLTLTPRERRFGVKFERCLPALMQNVFEGKDEKSCKSCRNPV